MENFVADLLWVVFAGILAHFGLKTDVHVFAAAWRDMVVQPLLFIIPATVAIGFLWHSIKDFLALPGRNKK